MFSFIFPGQGTQRPGMGRDLARAFPAARQVFDQADEVLGFQLSRLCFEGPAEELNRTRNAQPAILTVSVALLRIVERLSGATPQVVAGHSVGEYTALVSAGAISFENALRLVRRRGELMEQSSAHPQAMVAVLGLDYETVETICRDASEGQVLALANHNAPRQCVLSGETAAVERATALAADRGGRAVPLRVGVACHSPLMSWAAERFAGELSAVRFDAPDIPVISNVTARPYNASRSIPELLVRQLTATVRWSDSIRYIEQLGVSDAVEIGPHSVLSSLVEQTVPKLGRHQYTEVESVLRAHGELLSARRRSLLAANWKEKAGVLVSPDRTRALLPSGRLLGSTPGTSAQI